MAREGEGFNDALRVVQSLPFSNSLKGKLYFLSTIGDKIIDTLTFTTSYYLSYISFAPVKLTFSPNSPQNNVASWFRELWAIYLQLSMGEGVFSMI